MVEHLGPSSQGVMFLQQRHCPRLLVGEQSHQVGPPMVGPLQQQVLGLLQDGAPLGLGLGFQDSVEHSF